MFLADKDGTWWKTWHEENEEPEDAGDHILWLNKRFEDYRAQFPKWKEHTY